jgi:hypothetical protein
MRAMAAPSAGVAGACEVKVSESADAATRVDKVIFIRFLLDDFCGYPNAGRARHGAGSPCGPVRQASRRWTVCALTQNRTALASGAFTAFQNLRFKPYRKFSDEQVSLLSTDLRSSVKCLCAFNNDLPGIGSRVFLRSFRLIASGHPNCSAKEDNERVSPTYPRVEGMQKG